MVRTVSSNLLYNNNVQTLFLMIEWAECYTMDFCNEKQCGYKESVFNRMPANSECGIGFTMSNRILH